MPIGATSSTGPRLCSVNGCGAVSTAYSSVLVSDTSDISGSHGGSNVVSSTTCSCSDLAGFGASSGSGSAGSVCGGGGEGGCGGRLSADVDSGSAGTSICGGGGVGSTAGAGGGEGGGEVFLGEGGGTCGRSKAAHVGFTGVGMLLTAGTLTSGFGEVHN